MASAVDHPLFARFESTLAKLELRGGGDKQWRELFDAMSGRVVDGLADSLPAEDASFDVAVTGRVLCSVPEQAAALAEIRRVLKPGGELRFYEHVVASKAPLAAAQRGADRVFWTRAMGGCHTSRDTVAEMARAGFEIERCRRFSNPPAMFAAPFVIGLARVPG